MGFERNRVAAGTLLAALAIAACSRPLGAPGADGSPPRLADGGATVAGGGPDAVEESGPIDQESACHSVVRILCRKDQTCCAAQGLAVDVEKCAAWRRQSHDRAFPFPGGCEQGPMNSTGYDPLQARACLNEIARSFPDCTLSLRNDDPAGARIDSACDDVYAFTPNTYPGPGQRCTDQCSAPVGTISICEPVYDTDHGTCSPAYPLSDQGEPCSHGCKAGLLCLVDGTCGDIQPDGAACDGSKQCASNTCDYASHVCVLPTAQTARQCALLSDVSRYQLYFERPRNLDGPLGVNERFLLWPADSTSGATGVVRYAPKDGSGPIAGLNEGSWSSGHYLVDADYLYFYDYASIRVLKISFTDGQRSVFANLLERRFTPMAVFGQTMYLTAGGCEALAQIDLTTRQYAERPDVLPASAGCTAGIYCGVSLAFDGDAVYCATGSRLAVFDAAGGRVLTEAATSGATIGIQELHALNGRLYYLARDKLFAFDTHTLTVSPIVPPAAPTATLGSSQPPPSLKLDRARGHLYWIGDKALQRYDVVQGTFTALSAGELIGDGTDTQLAVDESYIYWMDRRGVFRRPLAD